MSVKTGSSIEELNRWQKQYNTILNAEMNPEIKTQRLKQVRWKVLLLEDELAEVITSNEYGMWES